ncbi:MAG: non-canonical purine NTP pyrophosphatase, partial [Candidatus Heimdallarchaeota archaeon]
MIETKKKSKIYFATRNHNKFDEIDRIFKQKTFIQLIHLHVSLIEIQSPDLEEIAVFSLRDIQDSIAQNLFFVEDSGLFIKQLNGFPGPYSAYVLKTLGLNGILTLMHKVEDREAYFQSSIAVKIENRMKLFSARVRGEISKYISETGWGYDPIFIPEANG